MKELDRDTCTLNDVIQYYVPAGMRHRARSLIKQHEAEAIVKEYEFLLEHLPALKGKLYVNVKPKDTLEAFLKSRLAELKHVGKDE